MAGKVRKSEDERRADLIGATIREVGENGSLDVTASQIARRAGVSSGLAFHYFHDKEGLFLAAMRAILSDYGRDVREALKTAHSPEARIAAIVNASFGKTSLRRDSISAWVNFYALALRSDPARRLLYVYHRRLHSNLAHALTPLTGTYADDIARRAAGLIDGLYLRYALDSRAGRTRGSSFDGTDGPRHVLTLIAAECDGLSFQEDALSDSPLPSPSHGSEGVTT